MTKINKTILVSIGLILSFGFKIENKEFLLLKTIPFKGTELFADHLGYYYLVGKDKIQKVHPSDSLTQFHQRQGLGPITSIDVTNPMKTLVYFNDYRTIEILDNWMTLVREIKLDDYGYMQISAICNSSTNGIWFYDENSATLKRIDDAGNLLRQSVSTRQSINKVLRVSSMIEKNGVLYLADSSAGVFTFDMFGNYMRTLPLRGVQKMMIQNDKIYYFEKGKFFGYQPETLTFDELNLPDSTVMDAVLLKNKLVTLSNDSVKVYIY
jgi:hypothetical protein